MTRIHRIAVVTTGLTLLASMLLSTAGYSELQTDSTRQQIQQAVASGNVQTVIEALPILESLWPQSMGDYFRSAEEIARFFDNAEGEPGVQQVLEDLYAAILNKRCPEDADYSHAILYFECKATVVRHSSQYASMRYNKPHLVAVSRFLGEIRDRKLPNYESKLIFFREAEVRALNEAGVCFASELSDPAHIAAYEKARKEDVTTRDNYRLQMTLFRADSSITSKLLHACKQLRHDGKLDEAFANEVAENARLTKEEREMRYPFDKNK